MGKRLLIETKRSELLRRAVHDAKKVSKYPWVRLEMDDWVTGTRKYCQVCMAGAVMLCLNQRDALAWQGPSGFAAVREEPGLLDKLLAINEMRLGRLVLGSQWSAILVDTHIPEKKEALSRAGTMIRANYDRSLGRAPWEFYLRAAKILEEVGL